MYSQYFPYLKDFPTLEVDNIELRKKMKRRPVPNFIYLGGACVDVILKLWQFSVRSAFNEEIKTEHFGVKRAAAKYFEVVRGG